MSNHVPASFAGDGSVVVEGPEGQLVHREGLAHLGRLQRRLWHVRPGVWCLVGNGLSNQTFVEGPEGLIVIDTGESVEEMQDALAEVRQHTQAPVAAVIYTHFHYVSGTRALLDEGASEATPIWGHDGIVGNLRRYGAELSAVAGRGLIHQFGMFLPPDGPDGLVHAGLGLWFRNPVHAPFTNGFIAPNNTFDEPTVATIAGLRVEFTPAPSDADDSVTVWFPELGVAVHNILWPALFNVFAIRGEEYRDPRVLLTGLDHLGSLHAEHLVGAHGPPLSGADLVAGAVVDYRDSIQYLWDQTVRGINRGLTMDELVEFVRLPDHLGESYLTQQLYGLAEHHVRQIYTGLRGWFDGDEASLFKLPPVDRCTRLIAGFGGRGEVRSQAQAALDADDLRWALELASWLVRSELDPHGRADGGSEADRSLLASILRTIAQRTTSANIRNWCLTRARELDGLLDLGRYRVHRMAKGLVDGNPPAVSVHGLRVLLDPQRAVGAAAELRMEFNGEDAVGLKLRNGVAVPTSGADASLVVALELADWAKLLGGRITLSEAIGSEAISVVQGTSQDIVAFFACFDYPSLNT